MRIDLAKSNEEKKDRFSKRTMKEFGITQSDFRYLGKEPSQQNFVTSNKLLARCFREHQESASLFKKSPLNKTSVKNIKNLNMNNENKQEVKINQMLNKMKKWQEFKIKR